MSFVEDYFELLDRESNEQEYQSFIETHTNLIPRHFVQNHGVHFDLLLRKLKISSDMVTDFVYLSKSSISWNYVLIEIEKPQSKYFKNGTLDLHADFLTGISQIKNWKSWFSQPENKAHFENQLLFLKKPISEAPVDIKYILVTGRRSEYEGNKNKISKIRSFQDDDFKIMSFDSLAEDAMRNIELYLGIRKGNSVELKTETRLSMDFLGWCDDSDFMLNQTLKSSFLDEIQLASTKGESPAFLGKLRDSKLASTKKRIESMKVINA